MDIRDSGIQNLTFSCPNLKSLKLSKAMYLSNIKFHNCDSLENLDLEWTSVTDQQVQNMFKDTDFKRLHSVKLHYCKNIEVLKFPLLPSVTYLDVSSTNVVRETVTEILNSMPNLTTLRLSYCQSLKRLLVHNHENLTYLIVDHCSRNLYHVEVTQCPKIKEIDMGFTAVNSGVVENILRENPHLEALRLNYCNKLRGMNLRKNREEEGDYLVLALKELEIAFTEISDEFVEEICQSCPELQVLKLRQSNIVSPSIRLRSLKQLDISLTEIDSFTMYGTLSICTELERLEIASVPKIIELSLPYHENLTYLDISRSYFEGGELEKLLVALPNLEFLDIGTNKVITQVVVENHYKLQVLGCNLCAHLSTMRIINTPALREIQLMATKNIQELELDCPNVKVVLCDQTSSYCESYLTSYFNPLGVKVINRQSHANRYLRKVIENDNDDF